MNYGPQASFSWLLTFCMDFKLRISFFSSFFFLLFRATPVAYGGSQARGQTRATAACLHHGHSNSGSKPRV